MRPFTAAPPRFRSCSRPGARAPGSCRPGGHTAPRGRGSAPAVDFGLLHRHRQAQQDDAGLERFGVVGAAEGAGLQIVGAVGRCRGGRRCRRRAGLGRRAGVGATLAIGVGSGLGAAELAPRPRRPACCWRSATWRSARPGRRTWTAAYRRRPCRCRAAAPAWSRWVRWAACPPRRRVRRPALGSGAWRGSGSLPASRLARSTKGTGALVT